MTKRNSAAQKIEQPGNEEKLAAFKAYKVSHKKMAEVTEEVKAGCRYLSLGCFIVLVGPPGIGKTTVMEGVYNSMLRSYMPQMIANAGFIPAIKINTNAEDGRFDWKLHWTDALRAIQEPLIDYKTLPKRNMLGDGGIRMVDPDGGGSKSVLRQAFESAAKNRGLRVAFHDEAHHFTLVPAARMILRQHEILKSAAERSEAIFTLFGTYDLLKLRNINGQLGRRTKTVHFERYRPTIDADVRAFGEAAITLLAHMPVQVPPVFSNEDLGTLFDMSLGCVGLLKDILVATLDSVLEAGMESVSIQDVIKHELPVDLMDRVSREIINGERKLKEDSAKRQLVKMRLEKGPEYLKDHPEEILPLNVTESELIEGQQPEGIPSKKQSKKKNRRIERSPKRDPVGAGRRKKPAA